mgnify:CR=1 FL=1
MPQVVKAGIRESFQFLIGRLVTHSREQARERKLQFQFLIGRLVTPSVLVGTCNISLFQFLIGRLVTVFFFIVSPP